MGNSRRQGAAWARRVANFPFQPQPHSYEWFVGTPAPRGREAPPASTPGKTMIGTSQLQNLLNPIKVQPNVSPQPAPNQVLTAPCPFCSEHSNENDAAGTGPTGAPVARRRRRATKVGRKIERSGKWWSRLGYRGPACEQQSLKTMCWVTSFALNVTVRGADCLRCSEVFRDHLMRMKPNSAGCAARILPSLPIPQDVTSYMCAQVWKVQPMHRLRQGAFPFRGVGEGAMGDYWWV